MEKKKTLLERIWDFLASVKLAIVLFALIALTSIIGTILEQQAEPEKNLQVIGKLFGQSLSPTIYRIFDNLGFMNMYRSWWFVMLLGLFASNILICSIDRFPRIWRLVRKPLSPIEPASMKELPIKAEFSLKGSPDKTKEIVGSALKSIGFNFSEQKEGEGYQLYSEKGRFVRLGVYITHSSVLVIFIGVLIGMYFGFKGFIKIPEGGRNTVAFIRTGHPLTTSDINEINTVLSALESSRADVSYTAQNLGVTESRLRDRMKWLGMIPFDFFVRCDNFEVEFYPGTDMPKSYTSLLTIIDRGREIISKWITVNDPLTYKGITFYQSSYELMPDTSNVVFVLKVTSAKGESETLRLKIGDKFFIPGTKISAEVADFSPALSFDKDGKPFTYTEMPNNPAIHIDIKGAKETVHKWVLKRYPNTGVLEEGHIIQLLDFWGIQYTGLQVRHDPGVWVVYLGCFVMSIGLYIVFFMSHRMVWIRLERAKANTKVTVGASANKNRQAFERKISKLVSLLRKGGK